MSGSPLTDPVAATLTLRLKRVSSAAAMLLIPIVAAQKPRRTAAASPSQYHLAEGVIAAARRLRPVEVVRREVRRGAWPGTVLAAYVNAGLSPQWLLRGVYGLDARALPEAALIVSAGGETLAA